MSAGTPVTKKVLAVRTYASDLADTRAERDHTVVTVPAPQTVPVVPTAVAHTTPTVAPGVKQKLIFTEPKAKKESDLTTTTVPPTTKKDTGANTAIPPFHTFQKPAFTQAAAPTGITAIQIPDGTHTEKLKPSILTGPSHGVTVGDEAEAANEATVITDIKRSKFSLTAAIGKSMSGWFQNKKDTLSGKNKPKYTVPQADRRKGVIQKATSMTGRTSTADHAEVLKRLRANKQSAGVVPVTTPKVVASEPTWTTAETKPDTDKKSTNNLPVTIVTPEAAPQPAVIIAPQKIAVVIPTPPPTPAPVTLPKVVPTIPVIAPQVPEPPRERITPIVPILPQSQPAQPVLRIPSVVVPIIPPTITPPPAAITPPPVITAITRAPITPRLPVMLISETPVTPLDTPETKPQLVAPIITPTGVPINTEVIAVEKSLPKRAPQTRTFRFRLQNIFTHTNRIVITGGVVAVCILVAGLAYRYYLSTGTEVELATNAELPVFNQMTQTAEPVVATSKEVIIAALRAAAAAPDSLTEVAFLEPTSSSSLTAETLFSLFGVRTLAAFTTSITTVSLGTYRTEPWLLLKVTDTPTARGGMLDWESRMSADLSPWYGAAVAAKKTSITAFTDQAIAGTDVRVLTDAQNTERITYGFVAPNYLLITSNTSAWLNLHEHWRTE